MEAPVDAQSAADHGDADASGGRDAPRETSGDADADVVGDVVLDARSERDVVEEPDTGPACPVGLACVPAACQTGIVVCDGGAQSCVQSDSLKNGTLCQDGGGVCFNGQCGVCSQGSECTAQGSCHKRTYDCSTGQQVCVDAGNVADGEMCGPNLYCNNGNCVPCTNGLSCLPPANPCDIGTVSCSNGVATCIDQARQQPNGTSCGVNQVCNAGKCVACVANQSCTPANPCHTGLISCATGTPTCVDTGEFQTNGSVCPATNLCDRPYTCKSGVCTPSATLTCAVDQCQQPVNCDPSTGMCPTPAAKPNGTACTDGNACTINDTCQGGTCRGGAQKACPATDACHVAGTCDTTSGLCSNPAAPNGTTCDDGNPCTMTSSCRAGVCVGANPVTCTASDQCHVAGTCDMTSGQCTNPIAPNGTTCTNMNACAVASSCQGGVCTATSNKVCNPGQCQAAGSCRGNGQCVFTNKADGTSCDAGVCMTGATCTGGACGGAVLVSCPPPADQCHVQGACQPTTGTCSNPAAPNTTPCDAGACVTGATCTGGTCGGGTPVACTTTVDCQVSPGMCNPINGSCSFSVASDGTPCSIGSCCGGSCCNSTTSTCVAGICTPLPPPPDAGM